MLSLHFRDVSRQVFTAGRLTMASGTNSEFRRKGRGKRMGQVAGKDRVSFASSRYSV